jgi:hypothetical protein
MFFFIEKVHILRITHFSETTKDRNLIFDMSGDANVKYIWFRRSDLNH